MQNTNSIVGQSFYHQDFKLSGKFIPLQIHKVYPTGAVSAHREGDKADERGYFDWICWFGLGLSEKDTRFL